MGKKQGGMNAKQEAGRAKKAANQAAKNAQAQAQAKAAESAEWSKGADARGDRKRAEQEAKRAELEAKKAEKAKLLALEEHALTEDKNAIRKQKKSKATKEVAKPWEEALKPAVKKSARGSRSTSAATSSFSSMAAAGGSSEKMTQAQMAELREAAAKKPGKSSIQFDTGFQANRNRDPAAQDEARSVDAALDLLTLDGGKAEPGKHPERRAKAAYKAFEEVTLPQLKEDFPGLKLSQYKQKLSEMWRRSPENPLNQESLAYNAKK